MEDRRLLSAVGYFRRDATPTDLEGHVWVKAIANGFDDSPPITQQFSDTMVRVSDSAEASHASEHAYAFAKAAGFILTADNATVAVPSVSFEGVNIANADQGGLGGSAYAHAYSAGHANSSFVYEDPDVNVPKQFYGAIYLPAVGVGAGSGEDFLWEMLSGAGARIYKNDSEIASVVVNSTSGGTDADPPGQMSWNIQITVPGQNPYSYSTSGANLYVNFITSIENNDEIRLETFASEASFSQRTDVLDTGNGESQALFNFIRSATAYGFAFEADNPPDLPPISDPGGSDENDGGTDIFDDGSGSNNGGSGPDNGGSAPGDLNGDGVVDDADRILWFNILKKASDESVANPILPLIVTTQEDVDDGDYAFHDLNLREAISLAAATNRPGKDTIVFAKWVDEIVLNSQLTVSAGNNVHIAGPGSDKLSIDGDGNGRVFSVSSGAEATISGMTITGGGNVDSGGGVKNLGNLTLESVVVSGNQTILTGGGTNHGGGIYSDGILRVFNSTIDGNQARYGGGLSVALTVNNFLEITGSTISNNYGLNTVTSPAIPDGLGGGLLLGTYGTIGTAHATITNSTISGNRSKEGAGLSLREDLTTANTKVTIVNSTITDNRTQTVAGVNISDGYAGGIQAYSASGTPDVTLHNTILAGNTSANTTFHDVWGALQSASSYNLIGQVGGSGLSNTSGNQVGVADAKLAPLGDYGGRTKTHALKIGSPAVDHGSDTLASSFDQRGYVRNFDLPAPNGAGGISDIGAYEAGEGTSLIVRSDGDRNNTSTLQATVDSLRLREAIALAAELAGTEEIHFDKTGWVDDDIQLSSIWGQLAISTDLAIVGPGADQLTIDAQQDQRVFAITSGVTATLTGIRITGGSAPSSASQGGGIWSGGNLTLSEVEIVDNAAAAGGGVYHQNGILAVLNSTIYDNTGDITESCGRGS